MKLIYIYFDALSIYGTHKASKKRANNDMHQDRK